MRRATPFPTRPMLATLCGLLIAACGGGAGGGGTAAETAGPTVERQAATPTAEAPAAPVTARALGTQSLLLTAPPTETPPTPAALPRPAGGQTWYVDSRLGDDSADGLGVDRAWRTLARLATAALQPGDRVVLACGSRWNETLRLARGGTAARPLFVGLPDGGCSDPPTIDGSVPLSPTAWVRGTGALQRLQLASTPMQLFGAADDDWVEAHHPNRDAKGPRWLALAADGDAVFHQDRHVSTRLVTGDDLRWGGPVSAATLRVRVRTAAFVVDDLPVASVAGRELLLATPTTYAVKAGWGYLLTGQAWMVDSAGEWHHDTATRTLTLHAGSADAPRLPSHATVLATGVDLQQLEHVVLEGLRVQRVGTGVRANAARSLRLRSLQLADIADRGLDAAASRDLALESSRIERTGTDAVFAGGIGGLIADGLVVRDNRIRASGVRLAGGVVRDLPRRSYATILAGRGATVSGNVVVDSGYIGIRVFEGSRVENNVVMGSCTVLDDCGAIYTLGAGNGSVIAGNLVIQARGNAAGKPAAAAGPHAQGLYLDDDASGLRVEGNTVIDADHGVHLHDAADNLLRGNRFWGNRFGQAWLQETRRRADGSGTLSGNRFESNLFAPLVGGVRSLIVETLLPQAQAFGSFDGNRYHDMATGRIASVQTASGLRQLDALDWFATPGLVSPGAADPAGTRSAADGHAGWWAQGGNAVPNGSLAQGPAGWAPWSPSAPAAQLATDSCEGRRCLRWVAGGGGGLLSSPNFSIEQGRWYRLTVDLAADGDAMPLRLVVRRGGGGRNGYETLSDRELALVAGRSLQRRSFWFQAMGTVRAGDPQTGDLGARIDFEGLPAGRTLGVGGVELVPVAPSADLLRSVALVNAGDGERRFDCPFTGDQAPLCSRLADLVEPGATARLVSWPLALPARGVRLLRSVEPGWVDADGDGVADAQDACPGTAPRQVVDAQGCALRQR